MPILRLFVSLVCVAGAAMALGAPSAFAASPSTAYDLTSIDTPFPQPTGRFGERHAATDDIDGDGVNDYFVGDLSEDVGALVNAGQVYAISGKTRAVIYRFISPQIQASASFGFFISVIGDVDGDGKNDIASGTDSQDATAATGAPCTPPAAGQPANGCNKDQGKAWVFSGGKNGTLLYEVNNPDPQPNARFGSRIGRAGDIVKADGTAGTDGAPESIMGASNNDVPAGCGEATPVPDGCRKNQGQAYIFNGKDGTVVRELNLPAPDQVPATCGNPTPPATSQSCGSFGLSVQGPGDVDGDKVPDQLVDAGSLSVTPTGDVCASGSAGCNSGQGAMYVFSGATGDRLARIDDPEPQAGATFGFQDAAPLSPGDVNGDGRADIFANGFAQNGPGPEVSRADGRIWVFDGKATVGNPALHGKVLYEPKDPTPSQGGQFAFSLDRTDYNKDGTPDLYVGQSPHSVSGTDQSGGTYIFNGKDGSLLKSLELPEGVRQAGTPPGPGNNPPGDLGSNLGWSVAAPGDLNGDGEPDFLAGATFQNVGLNKDEGRAFVFLSKASPAQSPGGGNAGDGAVPVPGNNVSIPPKATVCRSSAGVRVIGKTNSGGRVFEGTKGNDRICGTNAGDLITGISGRDVISGGGGNDRIDGGSGSDRINGNSGKDLISGRSGDDSISGSSGNDRINGNSGSDRINGNSGNDRLAGASGNDVISGSSGKDIISGGAGNDRLSGNAGPDRINGDSGPDRISGGSGGDRLKGSSGNDRIDGGRGRDRISGGSGRNQLKQ
jgi:Ca2+-binding RTX toxin-like protein